MRLSKQSTFGNTALVGNITYRMVGTYFIVILLGILLFLTPLFKWNFLAMAAYIALALVIIGQTPTHRSLMLNLYGILFKKATPRVVTEYTTANTLYNGIRDVEMISDQQVPAFKMSNGNYALVYTLASSLSIWSSPEDYLRQALSLKPMFNIFEGGEGFMIVVKNDSDTGMLQLERYLEEKESFGPEDDDYAEMSKTRRDLLHRAATVRAGRSIQQYGILIVKSKNIQKTVKALSAANTHMRPASNPCDVLLAAMGLEGGVDIESIQAQKER